MKHTSLVLAGWFAMISAFIAIPQTYLSFRLESVENPTSLIILMMMQLLGIALFTVITLYLKKFLNTLFRFHDTDKQINLMIMANVTAGILVCAGMCFPQHKETLSVVAMVLLVFQGILQIQFGYRLLKLPDTLGGMLKPFCYVNMLTGICVASLVFILVGVVVSALSDLMLGTIFFNVAKLTGKPDLTDSGEKM